MKGSGPTLVTIIVAGLLGGSAAAVAAQVPAADPSQQTPTLTTAFEPAFEYSIPSSMQPSAVDDRSILFGVAEGTPGTAWGEPQGTASETGARGVIVVDVRTAVTHPCGSAAYTNRGPLADSPGGFLADMQTKAGLVIEASAASMFYGRPALEADSGASLCGTADIHVGTGTPDVAGVSTYIVMDHSRITLSEVAGRTIKVEAWAGIPEDLEAWLPIADEFIDSIHFIDPDE